MRVEEIFEQTPGPKAGSAPSMNVRALGHLRAAFRARAEHHRHRGRPRHAERHYVARSTSSTIARGAVVPVLQQDAAQSRREPGGLREVVDPLTLQAYSLRLKFLRSEKKRAAVRHDVAAHRRDRVAHGHDGHLPADRGRRLRGRPVEMVDGFLTEPPADVRARARRSTALRTEMRGLQCVSERINRAADLESLLACVLEALEEYFALLPHDRSCLATKSEPAADDDGEPRLRRERRRRRSRRSATASSARSPASAGCCG